jgi:hypothetical protein
MAVPTPLPSEERKRFIEEALKRGAPKERIFADLRKLEGYGGQEVATADLAGQGGLTLPGGGGLTVPPSTSLPVTPQEQEEGDYFWGRTVPRMAAVAIPAGAASLATGGMALPLAMALEGGAAGLGDLAYQGANRLIRKEPIKPKESLDVALTTAAATGVGRTAFDVLSRLGGVAPQFTRYFRSIKNIGRYNRTILEPARAAEFKLGEEIKAAVDEWNSMKTAPRIRKEELIREATGSGVTVHAKPIIDALEQVKLQAPKSSTGLKLNEELASIQKQFTRIKKVPPAENVGNTYQEPTPKTIRRVRSDLTPSEVDELLTREIDNRIYKLSGSPKNQALAEALANARGPIREALLKALPPEARTATKEIYAELTKKEAAEKAISPGMVSLENKIRNLFKPGHEAEIEALNYISKKTGHDFIGAAYKIAQKRSFSPDQRLATKGLDTIMKLIRGTMARPAIKALAPLQSLAAPGAGGIRAGMLEEGRKEPVGPNP